ncbi:hypothetical protein MTR67_053575 [Solanum verrucosum]|uniref:Uncharacterized protein n=1 Tax=Solanum verrucosum TaxID=315347 RepID=A0AAF0V7U6_SOLVR|nr:hypothetical protein MTR67_053575 [Solanum verrucosum]
MPRLLHARTSSRNSTANGNNDAKRKSMRTGSTLHLLCPLLRIPLRLSHIERQCNPTGNKWGGLGKIEEEMLMHKFYELMPAYGLTKEKGFNDNADDRQNCPEGADEMQRMSKEP